MRASSGAIVWLLLWQFPLPVLVANAVGTIAFAMIVMAAQVFAAAQGKPVDALRYE